MKILLIAYEFPPSPSPQSLRWAYLSNRLADLGYEVHVLAPDIVGSMEGLPDLGPGVQVHHTFPGPVRALVGRWTPPRPQRSDASSRVTSSPAEPASLNWRGLLMERIKRVVSRFVFPDLRGEWTRPARRALPALLTHVRPDVVVSSHEPATTLELGLEAKRLGFPWVADLGDPVLTSYTRPHWRARARALERAVMHEADHVVVTTEHAHALLRDRHGGVTPVAVVTQAFDEKLAPSGPAQGGGEQLELLYTGRFYSFRDPRELVDAVLRVRGVRLTIASGDVPAWLVEESHAHPDRLRLLGQVPHRSLLAVQRQFDVLVNLANADPSQVPGKFYEYLGAGRPILHISAIQGPDVASELTAALRRGWSCRGELHEISASLARLVAAKRAGKLNEGLELGRAQVAAWSWRESAIRFAAVLRRAARNA